MGGYLTAAVAGLAGGTSGSEPGTARGRIVVAIRRHAMVNDNPQARVRPRCRAPHRAGVKLVVVHGGGPQISAQLKRHGLESRSRRVCA